MAPLAVVEHFDVFKHSFGQKNPVAYLLAADIISGPLPIRLREVN
jgi:hypothetical protein